MLKKKFLFPRPATKSNQLKVNMQDKNKTLILTTSIGSLTTESRDNRSPQKTIKTNRYLRESLKLSVIAEFAKFTSL
jgi:hypothetical protein